MAIDKDLILKLRNASQAGFADCKQALELNKNDLEASIRWLREKGISKATNKNALKSAHEGGTWVRNNQEGVAIIELNSETDFTANNKEFLGLAERIIDAILINKTGKIEDVLKLKSRDEMTVAEDCLYVSSITGEKIVLKRSRYVELEKEDSVSCYRHNNGRMSSFLIFDKKISDEEIKGLSVHYAANNPRFLTRDQVDQEWLSEERKIIVSNLMRENKPQQYHEKIIEDRINKLLSQITFLEQPYLYDDKKTIKEILSKLGTKVKVAEYYEVGLS